MKIKRLFLSLACLLLVITVSSCSEGKGTETHYIAIDTQQEEMFRKFDEKLLGSWVWEDKTFEGQQIVFNSDGTGLYITRGSEDYQSFTYRTNGVLSIVKFSGEEEEMAIPYALENDKLTIEFAGTQYRLKKQ